MDRIARDAWSRYQNESGFSLIEMLSVVALVAILTTLGAGALRSYWLTQSVNGGQDELISQLRRAQEQAVSESHPKVFGVRVLAGSSTWALVEYNPVGPSCTEIQSNEFRSGARVRTETFTSTAETTYCEGNLKYADNTAVPDRATSGYAWFYARGTATPGNIVLDNPLVSIERLVTVSPITGRVTGS